MPLQDSDPERRNLMMSSIVFIVYFYAGGKLSDYTVKLPLVNVEFEHLGVLALFAWVMLLWFAYRYWLTHSGMFQNSFNKEISAFLDRDYILSHTKTLLDGPLAKDNGSGWYVLDIFWKSWSLNVKCRYAESVNRNKLTNGISSFIGSNDSRIVKFSGRAGIAVTARAIIECFFSQPSFSSYVVPYMLFVLAVLGGVSNVLLE